MPASGDDVGRRLSDAANALRGPVDPADFKSYVFPLLFWKWISDTWDWERSASATSRRGFVLPEGTHWRDVTTAEAGLGARIAAALARLEQANPDRLAGMFGDAPWARADRLPETALARLVDAFNGLTLNPDEVGHDVLGQGYEYLLRTFADQSGRKAGEFFTPRDVVRLVIRILDPQPGETVYDPACGSGGMLVETISTVRRRGVDSRTLRLHGQEVSLATSTLARMNLHLHDVEDFTIVPGDTLRSPGLRRADGRVSTFDVVVANPPFSLGNWGADTWAGDRRAVGGVPPARNGDFAWIQHMVASMDPGSGRAGAVMAHGVLFRGGAEARIREHLVERDVVEAVVGLPRNMFHSTSIPACLLVLRSVKPERLRRQVLFIDAGSRFAKGRRRNTMGDEDVQAIADAYSRGGQHDVGGVRSRLVPIAEIEANGFDLSVGRYVKGHRDDSVDLAAAVQDYAAARAARVAAEQELLAGLAAAGISAV